MRPSGWKEESRMCIPKQVQMNVVHELRRDIKGGWNSVLFSVITLFSFLKMGVITSFTQNPKQVCRFWFFFPFLLEASMGSVNVDRNHCTEVGRWLTFPHAEALHQVPRTDVGHRGKIWCGYLFVFPSRGLLHEGNTGEDRQTTLLHLLFQSLI